MSAFYFDSATAWAQFQLRGGWKSLLIVSGVVSALTVFIITLVCQLSATPADKQSVLNGSIGFLLAAQGVILLFVASNLIGTSIRNDLTSRQIESHRLMPLAPLQAIVGYVAAVGFRMGFVCACLVAIGTVLCQMCGYSIVNWLMADALLLIFALVNWSVVAVLSFTSAWGFMAITIIQVVILISSLNSPILYLVPGVRTLCGPLMGSNYFGLRGGSSTEALIFSVGMQLALALSCLMAAARKYERDEQRGLPLWFSLGLMLIWVCASVYGIKSMWSMRLRGFHDFDMRGTIIGTMVVSLISGMMVMSSLASREIVRERNAHGAHPARRGIRWSFPGSLILCVLLFTCLTWIQPDLNGPFQYQPASPFYKPGVAFGVGAVCLITLLQAYVLMRMLYPVMQRANMFIGFIFGLLWIAPLIVDSIYDNDKYPYSPAPMDFFSMGSPLGWLGKADVVLPMNRVCGIAFQLAVLVLLTLISQLVHLHRVSRLTPALTTPQA